MSLGQHYYALLLRLLPAEFRKNRGAELLAVVDEMRSELGSRPGLLKLTRFYTRLTVDLLQRVPKERARLDRRASNLPGNGQGTFECRRPGPRHSLEGLWRDIRMALRSLTRRPAFLLVATLSLALGIGANTAIFSVVNAFFFKEYDYREPDKLVRVYTSIVGRTQFGTTSFPNYIDIGEFDEAFEGVGAYKTIFARLELRDETVRAMGEGVSHSLFPILGVDAAIGRGFLPEEDETPGAHPVMMLGYGFWQRAFGSDPDIIGTTLRLAGQSFTVVGVTPEGFHGLSGAGLRADFFVPIVMYGTASGLANHAHFADRLDRRYYVVARLAGENTPETAATRLAVLSHQIREANPQIDQEWAFSLLPMRDVAFDPDVDRAILPFAVLLMTAGGLVLVLSCTNLASFLLARATNRRKDIALRLALGAGRAALVRQLLTESVVLALLGGASGLLLAQWTLGLLTQFQPRLPVSITLELGLDATVLLFTFGISTFAGMLFGLAPALQATNPAVAPTLKNETGSARVRKFGLRNTLVALQMALSVVLLVGGGLFVRSLGAARAADVGFSTRDAAIAWVDLSISGVPSAQYGTVTAQLIDRARALPGVTAVTAATHIPFFGSPSGGFFQIPGADPPMQGSGHNVEREEVDPAFFETLGIPLVMGRNFTEEDGPGSPRVAIVNKTAVRWFWPTENPLGKIFSPIGSSQNIRVVGVVGDTKVQRLREPPKPLFYFALAQTTDPDLILVARGHPAATEIATMLRQMIRDVNRSLMIMETLTMEQNMGVILFPARMAAMLLGVFGVLALLLATIGLYGVVSFSVTQRIKEVGIRMSLGADSLGVIGMVLRGAMGLVGIGGLAGLTTAVPLAQLLRSVLYGVGPWDPTTILGVPLLLGSLAAAAALIPAFRASRVNPVQALRYE